MLKIKQKFQKHFQMTKKEKQNVLQSQSFHCLMTLITLNNIDYVFIISIVHKTIFYNCDSQTNSFLK